VTTSLNDTFPALFRAISSLYVVSGVEPVGRPSTNVPPAACFLLICPTM